MLAVTQGQQRSEKAARLLVRAMYRATDGECRGWGLPTKLNDLTKGAIAHAVARAWMLKRGDSVCLTDVGQDLVKNGSAPALCSNANRSGSPM